MTFKFFYGNSDENNFIIYQVFEEVFIRTQPTTAL